MDPKTYVDLQCSVRRLIPSTLRYNEREVVSQLQAFVDVAEYGATVILYHALAEIRDGSYL